MKHDLSTQVNDLLESILLESPADHRLHDTTFGRPFPETSGGTLKGALARLLKGRVHAPLAFFGLHAHGQAQGWRLRISDHRAPGSLVLTPDAGPAAADR